MSRFYKIFLWWTWFSTATIATVQHFDMVRMRGQINALTETTKQAAASILELQKRLDAREPVSPAGYGKIIGCVQFADFTLVRVSSGLTATLPVDRSCQELLDSSKLGQNQYDAIPAQESVVKPSGPCGVVGSLIRFRPPGKPAELFACVGNLRWNPLEKK